MFAGIVAGLGVVLEARHADGASRLRIRLPEGSAGELTQGCSISVDGVCLTVSGFSADIVEFDLMGETLSTTTLRDLEQGDMVNVERALRYGDEVGGHEMSGHVDGVARITHLEKSEDDHVITITPPRELMRYVMQKGFIAVDGCSLTIVDAGDTEFSVWLIPETLRRTRFAYKTEGDAVNIEVETKTKAIVDTTYRMMEGGA